MSATLGLDSSGFDKGIGDASGSASSFGEKFAAVAGGVGTAVTAITGAAVAIGTAMGAIAVSAAGAGDDIDKMSQKLGLSREGFQTWDYVLSQNGTSIESLSAGLKGLATTTDNAIQGNDAAIEKFNRLGISVDDLASKSREDIFGMVIQGLQGVEDETEKAAIGNALLGRSAVELAPLLNQTAEATQELKDKAHEYGLIMSDEAVDASVEFTDALDTAQRQIKNMAHSFGAELLPSLTQGLEAFSAFVAGADGAEDALQEAIDGMINFIAVKIPQFVENGSHIILSIAQGITGALPQLVGGVVEVIPTIAKTLLEMLPDIVQAGAEVLAAVVLGIAEALPELIPVAIDTVLTLVETLIDNIDLLIDASIQLVLGLTEGIINSLPILIERAPEIIEKLVTAIVDNLPLLITAAVDIVIAIAEGIVQNLPLLYEAAYQIIGSLVSGILELVGSLYELSQEIPQKIATFFVETDWLSLGKNIIEGIISGIGSMVGAVADSVKNVAQSIFSGFTSFFQMASPSKLMHEQGGYIVEGLADGMDDSSSLAENTAEDISELIKDDLSDVDPKENNLDQWISDLDSTASSGVPGVVDNIVSIMAETPSKISDALSPATDILTQWVNSLTEIGNSKFNEFLSTIVNIMTQVPGKINEAITPAKTLVEAWGNALIEIGRNKAEQFVQTIINIVTLLPGKFYEAIQPTIAQVTNWGNELVKTGQTAATDFVNAVINAVKDLPAKFYTAIQPTIAQVTKFGTELVAEGKKIGVNFVEGIWDGIDSKSSWLYQRIAEFARKIAETVKKELDIKSPSRVMADIGKFTAEGFIVGLERMAAAVDRTVADIFNPDLSLGADFTGVNGFGGGQVAAAGAGSGGGNTYNTTVYPANAYSEQQLANRVNAELTKLSWGWR